jgi:hypothetical protein
MAIFVAPTGKHLYVEYRPVGVLTKGAHPSNLVNTTTGSRWTPLCSLYFLIPCMVVCLHAMRETSLRAIENKEKLTALKLVCVQRRYRDSKRSAGMPTPTIWALTEMTPAVNGMRTRSMLKPLSRGKSFLMMAIPLLVVGRSCYLVIRYQSLVFRKDHCGA